MAPLGVGAGRSVALRCFSAPVHSMMKYDARGAPKDHPNGIADRAERTSPAPNVAPGTQAVRSAAPVPQFFKRLLLTYLLPYLLPHRQRSLIWQFARRDVLARYRGSLLGLSWSFLTPLLMLGIYTFVFREVFNARWPASAQGGSLGDGNVEFALQVYAGLIVFNLFAEVMARAPRLVLDQPNLVKKVVFPLEILPWVAILAGLFHLVINLAVLLTATLVTRGSLPPTIVALPLIVAAFLPLLLGFSWLLAALGVFLRDIGQLIGMVMTALMFLSPVFYPADALPKRWQPFLLFNPMTLPIEQLRRVMLDGLWPNWDSLALYAAAALLIGWLGAGWFAATRKGFADVL